MLGDLRSPRLIHLKGGLFLLIGLVAGGLIVVETWNWRITLLLGLCVWGFCRFYYYAFYVIEKYVDPSFKFAGLASFMAYWLRRKE